MRIALLCLALVALLAATVQADTPARARATATLATGTLGTYGQLSASGTRHAFERFSVEDRGIRVESAELSARADRAVPSARAVAAARSVSLLDGLVTAYGVRRDSDGAGRVSGLRIDGRFLGDVAQPRTFEESWGSVVVNTGERGLVVTLTSARNGFPGGTQVVVAEVTESVRRATTDPEPTATPEAKSRKARKSRRTSDRARRRAAARARLAAGDFVFPVFGPSVSYSDDFGGPRQIGPHQGNDIFGPFGAPVVAVADGVLEKVGTLPISGNRLWLRTDAGDTFFYAHLSAFAPDTASGRRVRQGALLGFVGNTGDAEPTPPHLHFEIHPKDGKAIDPFKILGRWRRVETGSEAAPGALVTVKDFIAG